MEKPKELIFSESFEEWTIDTYIQSGDIGPWYTVIDKSKYDQLNKKTDKLAEALKDVIYGEPPDFATKYVYAEKILKEYGYED